MTAEAKTVTVRAAAKINLYLHVTGVREDGYHTLDSLIAFAGVHDTITLTPASDIRLTVAGPFAGGLDAGGDNLVSKAVVLLQHAANIDGGAAMVLEKNLPVASGIGGGSADAAAALAGLARLWGLDSTALNIQELGLSLGADVPVCVFGRTAFIDGIGELISPAATLPPAWLVLVNPGTQVSTPAVFQAYHERGAGEGGDIIRFNQPPASAQALAEYLHTRRNDLDDAAIGLQPVICDVLESLQRADQVLLARMSGSGATCFGLFADADGASRAAVKISQRQPAWWVQATTLISDSGTLPETP